MTPSSSHIILAQYTRPPAIFLNKNSYKIYISVKCVLSLKMHQNVCQPSFSQTRFSLDLKNFLPLPQTCWIGKLQGRGSKIGKERRDAPPFYCIHSFTPHMWNPRQNRESINQSIKTHLYSDMKACKVRTKTARVKASVLVSLNDWTRFTSRVFVHRLRFLHRNTSTAATSTITVYRPAAMKAVQRSVMHKRRDLRRNRQLGLKSACVIITRPDSHLTVHYRYLVEDRVH